LCRELLRESGSIFVQINDENLHLVRCLLDEVFGRENFVAVVAFRKTGSQTSQWLPTINDYLLWYARSKSAVKYRLLFVSKDISVTKEFQQVQLPDGTMKHLTSEEQLNPDLLPQAARVFKSTDLQSRTGTESTRPVFEFRGRKFSPRAGAGWRTTLEGLKRLAAAERILAEGSVVRYVHYLDDAPGSYMTNVWMDMMGEPNRVYAVQTNTKVVERCILMTTDPGDLVFDPTCGSGTTAYVAEKWGRRWITCDTSRVAITLARQRLMTAVFDYYELAHPQEGVGSGFKYKTVPHITLKSIANNREIDDIYARLHPAVEEALAELNTALKGQPVKFKVTQGGRAGHFVDFAAPDTETFTMPAGQVVKVNELVEWEVPFEFPADWPEAARTPFERFHQARRALQAAIDEAIARHAPQETLYDQPFVDRKKVRVTGPFTVEAVPAPAVKSVDEILEPRPEPADASIARSGETLRQEEWRDELLKTGIRGKNGQYIRFAWLEPLPGCRWLHAVGETRPSDEGANTVRESAPAYDPLRVVVSFGPEYGPLEQRQVEQAWEEARMLVPRPKLLIFAAFQFDPEAAKDIDEMKPELAGMQFLKVQMNADLLTDDLKKKRASNESFWLIGQPDVYLERIADGEDKGKYRVSVLGFDYYNTKTGQIESGGADRIAVWMLDTDYDGRSLYPRQVFFPMAGEKEGWAKLARNLRAEIDEERIEAYRGTVSLPFALGEHRRIAVKIVDDRGIESLKVVKVDP
jgi:adenine-specific DNA-methyltransferase